MINPRSQSNTGHWTLSPGSLVLVPHPIVESHTGIAKDCSQWDGLHHTQVVVNADTSRREYVSAGRLRTVCLKKRFINHLLFFFWLCEILMPDMRAMNHLEIRRVNIKRVKESVFQSLHPQTLSVDCTDFPAHKAATIFNHIYLICAVLAYKIPMI